MWRLSRGCEEAVIRVWRDCLDGVELLSGVCGEAVLRVLGVCLQVMERLSGGSGEAVGCRKNVFGIC